MDDPHDEAEDINLIVTVPFGRSGSVLVQSLFDSHPNVLTLPYFGPLYARIPAVVPDLNRQIDWFIRNYSGVFDTSLGYFGDVGHGVAGKFGPRGDEDLIVDASAFRNIFISLIKSTNGKAISRKQFFLYLHIAYGLCVRKFIVSDIKYIFVHPHWLDQDDDLKALLADFPELYLIAMTRDPRQDWSSTRRLQALLMATDVSKVKIISLLIKINEWSNSTYGLSKLVGRLNPSHVRVVDLEKLHVRGEAGVRALSDWLGLEFTTSLLESSFNGRQWAGNATSQNKLSSLNPKIIRDAWRSDLPEVQVECIEVMLPGTLQYLGYHNEGTALRVEEVKSRFKYRNILILLYHCFLHGAKNPLAAFFRLLRQTVSRLRHARPAAGSSKEPQPMRRLPAAGGGFAIVASDARKVLRKTGVLVQVGVRSVGLARKFYGKGLDSTLDEMAGQQRRLLEISLPANVLMD